MAEPVTSNASQVNGAASSAGYEASGEFNESNLNGRESIMKVPASNKLQVSRLLRKNVWLQLTFGRLDVVFTGNQRKMFRKTQYRAVKLDTQKAGNERLWHSHASQAA